MSIPGGMLKPGSQGEVFLLWTGLFFVTPGQQRRNIPGESRMDEKLLSTREIAIRFRVNPETIRRALCVDGHYMGLNPLKLPNGRLLWPDVYPQNLAIAKEGER